MSLDEAMNEFAQTERKKKLAPYQDWIVNWLREYPNLSGAQILDWLQKRFPEIDVSDR